MIGPGSLGGVALLAVVLVAAAAPGGGNPARPSGPLGAHAPVLEGTWELVALRRPDGTVLEPPVATGAIVVDGGHYLAASYLAPSPERKVGTLWEGSLEIVDGRFRVRPTDGFRYDSAADPPVDRGVPPATEGAVEQRAEGLVFVRPEGGTITWNGPAGLRVQQEPDGTVIEHRRTSLSPRVPEDLPGREAPPSSGRRAPAAAPGRDAQR